MGTLPSVLGQSSCTRSLSPYQTMLRALSQRLVDAQRPIRILEAVRWDTSIEESFFAKAGRELPAVTQNTYAARSLSFDPCVKRQELRDLARDVHRCLGTTNPVGKILFRTCEEYRQVIDMLVLRGTSGFTAVSKSLYGSSGDSVHAGGPSLADMARTVDSILDQVADFPRGPVEGEKFTSHQAASELSRRLGAFFGKPETVRVQVSGDLLADAAAGCDYLKIREDAWFTQTDIRLLEVHEGWVHLGTTLNGQAQPICTFLSKGPPSSTVTQEGLAVLTEVLSHASHPHRVRRLLHRVEGVHRAESGADFLEVFRFFLDQGYEEHDSYHQTVRIFRGSLPKQGGPFTKDLSYIRGFVLVTNYLRDVLKRGLFQAVALLFSGKTNLGDLDTLCQLANEGLVTQPRFLPPPFADLAGLSSWVFQASGSAIAPNLAGLL